MTKPCRAAKLAIREEIMRDMERERLRAEAGDAMEEDTDEPTEMAEILPRFVVSSPAEVSGRHHGGGFFFF